MSWNIAARNIATRNFTATGTGRSGKLLAGVVLAAGLWLAPFSALPVAAQVVGETGAITCERCKGCGCKGGPGYRGPNGRCVGHRQLAKVCGVPANTNCKAEQLGSVVPVCNKAGSAQTSSRSGSGRKLSHQPNGAAGVDGKAPGSEGKAGTKAG